MWTPGSVRRGIELSAGTFHPYGVGNIWNSPTINILPLRGSREFSGHFFRRRVAAVPDSSPLLITPPTQSSCCQFPSSLESRQSRCSTGGIQCFGGYQTLCLPKGLPIDYR